MTARLDPFVDVLLREQADQLSLLPDEPVTIVKDGKPRKVSKQPLTDAHIYALLAEIAPSDSADKIDRQAETEFEYVADRGLVRVRIVPETGRLTAVISPSARPARSTPQPAPPGGVERRRSQGASPPPKAPPPPPPRPSAIAAAPLIESPVAPPEPPAR